MIPTRPTAIFQGVTNWSALVVILIAFTWSASGIWQRQQAEKSSSEIVLRIGHWQLETGSREAFTQLAREYEKRTPGVKIIQEPVPETLYALWGFAHQLAGDPPDILERGLATYSPSYEARFLMPLTEYVNHPNPYNRNTDQETVPWRKTLVDGMLIGYNFDLAEYVAVPLASPSNRIIYNRTLYKQLTGKDTPPATLEEFFRACEIIGGKKQPNGRPYVPIANSRYHFDTWVRIVTDVLTLPMLDRNDLGMDGGTIDRLEQFAAVRCGLMDFSHPALRDKLELARRIAGYSPPGYLGLSRLDAVSQFIQQKSVFLIIGIWDLRGIQKQAFGEFESALMDFPSSHPWKGRYKDFDGGFVHESNIGSFPLSVTRASKNPHVAVDFIQFLSSVEYNGEFNRITGWMPSAIGAEIASETEIFRRHTVAGINGFTPYVGTETTIKWRELFTQFVLNQISLEGFIAQFGPYYEVAGQRDLKRMEAEWTQWRAEEVRLICTNWRWAMTASTEEKAEAWRLYRRAILEREIGPDIQRARMLGIIRGKTTLDRSPYEYSEFARANIRRAVQSGTKE